MSAQELKGAVKRVLKQPAFLIAVVVLAVAAVSLNAVVSLLELRFKKEPVPLRRPLSAIPDRAGPWVQVGSDRILDRDSQEALGTEHYIFRDYVDERLYGSDVQSRFRGVDSEERNKMLGQLLASNPHGVVSLAVTYYTGMVDTVAHIPDRCVVADGYQPTTWDEVTWPIGVAMPESATRNGEIKVRYINFEDQTGTARIPRSIAYFFHVNGRFESSPFGVRAELQDLFQRYAYYAKVEVMTLIPNPEESAKVMTDFLTASMPEIYRSLPDWEQVTQSNQGKK